MEALLTVDPLEQVRFSGVPLECVFIFSKMELGIWGARKEGGPWGPLRHLWVPCWEGKGGRSRREPGRLLGEEGDRADGRGSQSGLKGC